MSSSKLSQFAVIYDKTNWDQYKHEMVSQLADEKPQLSHAGAVSFPADPREFPCLVASMLIDENPTKANNFCHCRISCCYVYPKDAQRLMDAQSQLDASILVDEEEETYPLLEATPPPQVEEEYVPTQTGVLLLALVNELEAVGALKRDKLLREVRDVEQWLIDNQADNVEDASLSAVLQRMWRDKDAR